MTQYKYSGDLGDPIKPDATELRKEGGVQREIERIAALRMHRMMLLFKEIDVRADAGHDPWMLLAYGLALRHVPGLQISAAKRGAATKWGPVQFVELWRDVEELMATGKSEIDACRKLVREKRYPSSTAGSLQRRLAEARKAPFVAAMIKLMGFVDEIDSTTLAGLANNYIEAKRRDEQLHSRLLDIVAEHGGKAV